MLKTAPDLTKEQVRGRFAAGREKGDSAVRASAAATAVAAASAAVFFHPAHMAQGVYQPDAYRQQYQKIQKTHRCFSFKTD